MKVQVQLKRKRDKKKLRVKQMVLNVIIVSIFYKVMCGYQEVSVHFCGKYITDYY